MEYSLIKVILVHLPKHFERHADGLSHYSKLVQPVGWEQHKHLNVIIKSVQNVRQKFALHYSIILPSSDMLFGSITTILTRASWKYDLIAAPKKENKYLNSLNFAFRLALFADNQIFHYSPIHYLIIDEKF